jgi:hypothetical protein
VTGCACDDGSCSFACCTEIRKRGAATATSSRLPISGGYYRNGKVYDELPFGYLRAGKTAGLGGFVDVSLNERSNLGGEPMKAPSLLLAGMCGLAPMLCAQQDAVPTVSLKAATKIEVRSHRATLSGQAMCDDAGNVYIRQQDAQTSPNELSRLPIQSITPAGAVEGNFRVRDAFPGLGSKQDVSGMGVFVDHAGKVYQAATANDGVYWVVEFARDGAVKAKTKLDTSSHRSLSLDHLVVFSSGEYLLAGEAGMDRRYSTPFTAVFASDGRLVKEIYEPEDDEARQKAEVGDLDYALNGVGNQFVSLGDAATDSDGNAYLLRHTPRGSPTLVYVISRAGDVVRKLRIEAGDFDLVARGIKSYDGRLAIMLGSRVHTDQYRVKVIDLQGNSIADYAGPLIGDDTLALACYNSEGLTMVPYFANPELYLLKAKLPSGGTLPTGLASAR